MPQLRVEGLHSQSLLMNLRITIDSTPAFQAGHMNASEFARICGLSRTTVYKYLKLLE